MPLHKVDPKYLKEERKIYLQDPKERLHIYLFYDVENHLESFQLSFKEYFLEWRRKKASFSYGEVDEGEEGMGVKKSPVVYFSKKMPEKLKKYLIEYLAKEKKSFPEVEEVYNILKEA